MVEIQTLRLDTCTKWPNCGHFGVSYNRESYIMILVIMTERLACFEGEAGKYRHRCFPCNKLPFCNMSDSTVNKMWFISQQMSKLNLHEKIMQTCC